MSKKNSFREINKAQNYFLAEVRKYNVNFKSINKNKSALVLVYP
jgi:hypothetical protein